jgi:hypothetical protein
MFWQVILFIIITLGVIVLRVLSKAIEDVDEKGLALVGLIVNLGLLFYAPFAIKWSLSFLIGYVGLSYWALMGLYMLRNVLFNKLDEKKEWFE